MFFVKSVLLLCPLFFLAGRESWQAGVGVVKGVHGAATAWQALVVDVGRSTGWWPGHVVRMCRFCVSHCDQYESEASVSIMSTPAAA